MGCSVALGGDMAKLVLGETRGEEEVGAEGRLISTVTRSPGAGATARTWAWTRRPPWETKLCWTAVRHLEKENKVPEVGKVVYL